MNNQVKVKKNFGLKFGILIASIISFMTTMTGMYAIADINPNELYYKSTIMLVLFVILIQSSLVYSIQYFEFRNLFNKLFLKTIVALLVYIVMSLFSILFSFTYWYTTISAQNHALRSTKIQLENIDEILLKSKKSLDAVVKSVNKLSMYSEKKAKEEISYGGTCQKSAVGYGHLTQIRLDDKIIASSASLEVKKIYQNLSEDMVKIQNKVSKHKPDEDIKVFEEIINQEIQALNAQYFTGSQFEFITDTLLARSGSNRNSIKSIHKDKKTVAHLSCIDMHFTKDVRKVISKLNSLKPIKKIKFFNVNDPQELVNRTKNVLWASLGFIEIKEVEDMSSPSDITTEDMNSLGLAITIDLLILALSILDSTPTQQKRRLSLVKIKKILDGEMDSSIYLKLQPFMAERFNSYLIAIPNDLSDEDTKAINFITQYIKLKNMAKLYAHEVKATKLKPYFQQSLGQEYANSSFKIYKMRKKQLEALLLEDISGEVA